MQKTLFKASPFRLRNVYGLPTLSGLVLFGILSAALWFSVKHDSAIERWIFLMMIVMLLIHLLETSFPFRLIEVKVLAMDPPFRGEKTRLNVQIVNPTNASLNSLQIKINKQAWYEVSEVLGPSVEKTFATIVFDKEGPQPAPRIRFQSVSSSGLFRYWRVIRSHEKIIVLPKPVDHHVRCRTRKIRKDDGELSHLVEILDPSRFQYTDAKLLRKTKRRYQRTYRSKGDLTELSFLWDDLKHLSRLAQGEQFSFWLQWMTSLQNRQDYKFQVEAPFFLSPFKTGNVTSIKASFAKWFYADS